MRTTWLYCVATLLPCHNRKLHQVMIVCQACAACAMLGVCCRRCWVRWLGSEQWQCLQARHALLW
jgi:hypothetical protein